MDKKIAALKALLQRPSNAATQSDWRALLSGLFMVLVGRVEVSKCRVVLGPAFAGGRGGVGSSEGGLFACMSVQAVASGGAKSVTERAEYHRATGKPSLSRGFKGGEALPACAAAGRPGVPAGAWLSGLLEI